MGLIIGSFLNVCILRIPAGLSVVRPSSRCPKCHAEIKAYDNIPVLSWLILGGKCRGCKTKISPMYPAIEFLTGVLFVVCYLLFGESLATAKWSMLSALLVVLTATDIRERILPDVVNLSGFVIGISVQLFYGPDGRRVIVAF